MPNVRACLEPVRPGMKVARQNGWPSVDRDVTGVLDRLSFMMPAGFYYKIFHKPAWVWPKVEPIIRRAAGLGKALRGQTMSICRKCTCILTSWSSGAGRRDWPRRPKPRRRGLTGPDRGVVGTRWPPAQRGSRWFGDGGATAGWEVARARPRRWSRPGPVLRATPRSACSKVGWWPRRRGPPVPDPPATHGVRHRRVGAAGGVPEQRPPRASCWAARSTAWSICTAYCPGGRRWWPRSAGRVPDRRRARPGRSAGHGGGSLGGSRPRRSRGDGRRRGGEPSCTAPS